MPDPNDNELGSAFDAATGDIPRFWTRIGGAPDLKGKRVLDLGCGVGAMCLWAARQGAASVVGVDTEERLTGFGNRHIAALEPELAGIVELRGQSLEDYQGEGFDVVITKDVFEHVMDLDGLLDHLRSRLNPGGRIFAGFGPLYNSPFGHHGRTHPRKPWKRLPWVHLLESERRICKRLNRFAERGGDVFRYSDDPIASIKDLGLSKISFRGYVESFERSKLSMRKLLVNRSGSKLSKILSALRRLPLLREMCTHNIYCVLEKPGETTPRGSS